MAKLQKSTRLRGIFSAESPDRSAEIVKIDGVDLSAINEGKAFLNVEHNPSFAAKIGKITKAKKIFSEKDCLNKFEKDSWNAVGKVPLIVGEIDLFDDPDDDHEEARAVASIVKRFARKHEPLQLGFSLEGGKVKVDGAIVQKSIVRAVALTCSPCNEAARAELMSELSKSEGAIYEKISSNVKTDNTLGSSFSCELVDDSSEMLQTWSDKLSGIKKALEAGLAIGGAGSLTQGAALQAKAPVKKAAKSEASESSRTKGKEETSGSTDESSKAPLEANGLNPIDKEVVKEIDENKDEATLKVKRLKKSELFSYSFFKDMLGK